ncbi:MAG: 3-dehydroquinate synthase [Dehalococcoidia bacterium]|nr:3-dehydroquinate synthase [Dehalococcoidia bacterium]
MTRPQRIVLSGFSGTGKSIIAPIIVERLGWEMVDTDSLVEDAAGRPIADIFARDGEARFRELEAEAVRQACARGRAVVAVGGGATLRPDSRRLLADGGFVVCLEARPETVLQRLREGEAEERPLLAGPDPLSRIRELKAARQPVYALADHTVHTAGLTPDEVAAEVVRAWEERSAAALAAPGRLEAMAGPAADAEAPVGAACVVRVASASYPVFVEWDALPTLGRRLREAGLTSQAYLISDEDVFARYGMRTQAALEADGIPVASYTVPPGEASKSLETAAAVYDWLIERRAERGHTIVALGGGMVTDLAGFVAATYARGLPLVQVPTSLLAMVDAAVGGKVAVNHPRSKNAIGAFYQPRLVLADVSTLRTLPQRELSGWAEAIKHALILDAELLAFFEEHAEAVLRLEPEPTTEAVRRSVAIKAAVVSEVEREETGRRTILNYGHTVGHAIEAATAYGRFRHGEADAIGMTVAAAISRRLGLLSPAEEHRQRELLARFGLPASANDIDRSAIISAIALDKKVRAGAVRWVLLEGIGRAVLRDDVPSAVVEEALDGMLT